MFILEVTYTVPLDTVDDLLEAHVAWVEAQMAAGVFLAAGRKVPRDGGVILAAGPSRAEVEKLVTEDPFVVADVCTYRITEFVATRTAPALAAVREELPS
ncbi:YciI family protein [Streptomyces sp. NPDC089919]|uniref:YciI family protein n=1 Tax=Streptomyces sp. NPDC089919 TaxID=3155188 RepID=UPI00343EBC1F